MNWLNIYILFIIIVKILFVGLTFFSLYLRAKGKKDTKEHQEIEYWKTRTEFVFVISMAALLIYVFNPFASKPVLITKETRTLFYLFGIVILITADWDLFISEKNVIKILRLELINEK